MKGPSRSVVEGMCAILVSLSAIEALAQDSSPAPAASSSSSSASGAKKQKYSHANDFLIIGTVFNEKGYALPGVELRIRRSGEKKFRWDSYTNSRGDFAVRVPQGAGYEMIVHAKGFADQARTMDARSGVGEARVVIRMEPVKDTK